MTANNVPVQDRPNSHFHLEAPLLAEALSLIEVDPTDPSGEPVKLIVPLGRIVGDCTCVETMATDVIVYARRQNRAGLTRFVKHRNPEACSSVVLVLKPVGHALLLLTAFVGSASEREPWDRMATEQSHLYWATHALIWGSEPIVPGTEIGGS